MIGVLVVTHGQLATELVASARTIVGGIDHIDAVSIDWNDDVNDARERIRTALCKVNGGHGVLILTDMFGGTPTNLALTFFEKRKVEVITGVNLPMLIKLASLKPDEDLAAVAQKIRSQGQKSIYLASEVLAQTGG